MTPSEPARTVAPDLAGAASAALAARPRAHLARLPTPLHEAARLRAALGGPTRCPRILLKRDDTTDLALGGNKARKLEFILGEALEQGATVLVTTGGVQSNHARMTAAAACLNGMRSALVLTATASGDPAVTGNLRLDQLLGAEIHFVRGEDDTAVERAENEKIDEVMDAQTARGEKPYLVPLGGSSATGVLGYVDATRELVEQLDAMHETPVALYHASGSRGTQAGLELGARIFAAPYRVHGIAVSGGEEEKRERAVRIAAEAADLLGLQLHLDADELLTDQDHYGDGYAIPTAEADAAIRFLARTEAVLLDPVYTAKAMAGMITHIQSGRFTPDQTIIFLHTGGVPGFFA